MAKLTAKEFQQKHNRNTKNAQQDMQNGVKAVEKSPTKKAADSQDKMRANLIGAIDNGKWAASLNKVDVNEWKKAMLEKGVPRVSAGLDGAADKIEAFADKLLPFIDGAKADVESMPDVTLEDNINRMTSFIRRMSEFSKTG